MISGQIEAKQPGYLSLFIVMSIATLLSFSAKANGTERWRPQRSQFEMRERVRDCSVYRSVLSGNEGQLAQKQTLLRESLTSTHLQFNTLEQCARAKGLLGPLGINSDETEQKSAEACTEEYQAWLNEGMLLQMLESDVSELSHQVSELSTVIKDRCVATVVAQNGN